MVLSTAKMAMMKAFALVVVLVNMFVIMGNVLNLDNAVTAEVIVLMEKMKLIVQLNARVGSSVARMDNALVNVENAMEDLIVQIALMNLIVGFASLVT